MVTSKPTTHLPHEDSGFLTAAGLSKSFDGAPVVDDVSFSIGRQEIFGLLGSERRRQDDHDQDALHGAGARRGRRDHRRPLGAAGGERGAEDHRRLPPGARPLRRVVGQGQSGLLRADGRTRSQAGEGCRRREPGVRRAGGPGVGPRAEVLRGHEAAGQPGGGPDEQARAPVPGRAHRGGRPAVPATTSSRRSSGSGTRA